MNDLDYLKDNGIDTSKIVNDLGVETYKELLECFLNGIELNVNNLRNSLINGNMADYSTYAHAIKGESLYLGFIALARQALEHQNRSSNGDINYISQTYSTLISEVQRVINVVSIYLGRIKI